MLVGILMLLAILWILGMITVPGLPIRAITLFAVNGLTITLWDALVFFVILWAIDALASPLREICAMLFLLFLLSTFKVIVITGFTNIIVLSIIVGIVISLFRK